jgi:hypothetical protein
MLAFLSAVGALLSVVFWLIGAYIVLRFGSNGVAFLWSKEFPEALMEWQEFVAEELNDEVEP